jgi:hypothetical protein
MSSTPRRHRRSRGADASTSGWDHLPPVASPVDGKWQPRSCSWKTPQHLASLQLPDVSINCDPLILNDQKHIMAASSSGDLYLFRKFEEYWKVTLPSAHLSLPSDATIVSLMKMGDEVLVLSVEGRVHKVAIVEDKIELKTSWKTKKQCGATCMRHLEGTDTLILGFESGCIEARKMDHDFEVKWTGYFHHPIRSLATLKKSHANSEAVRSENKPGGDELKPTAPTTDPKVVEGECFLIVTLQSEIGHGRHATASMIEVLDLKAIPEGDHNNCHSLFPYVQLPEPGMEFIDTGTLSSNDLGRLPKRVHVLPSRGSDVAFSLGDNLCGVALSDGTLAFVSTVDDSAWGIANDWCQLLLSYPAVGCGMVEYKGVNHWACCLRGGTCYLIPTNGNDSDITLISYPLDIETDIPSPYVQGFTAGALAVNDEAPSPVLVYAWAGGVIDVFGCDLVYPRIQQSPEEGLGQRATKEMRENGCLDMVEQLIRRMTENPNHELFQDRDWREAHSECAELMSTEPITIEEIQSKPFEPLKRLILSLAANL